MARKRLSAIRAVKDPARRVKECRDLLASLSADRDGLAADRDVAAMASIVHGGKRTSEVAEQMGVWRTAWVKARARVKTEYAAPPPAWAGASGVSVFVADYGYVPDVPDAFTHVGSVRKQIDRLDAYMGDIRAVRDRGCQALADAGYRNFQIRDLAGVSSSYISQMGLGRPVESITSAQQARKALQVAASEDPERAEKIRLRADENGWML